jgi:hypothetical protein
MGLIGRPWTAAFERGGYRPCTLVILFIRCGRGGAAVAVGGKRRSLERVGSMDLGRGGDRGSRSEELVTIEVQAVAPCWPWEEPTGPADGCQKSQRNPGIRGSPGGNRPIRRASGLVTVRVH